MVSVRQLSVTQALSVVWSGLAKGLASNAACGLHPPESRSGEDLRESSVSGSLLCIIICKNAPQKAAGFLLSYDFFLPETTDDKL
jgi:hypothetical protein